MSFSESLCVVVPVGPADEAWKDLLRRLATQLQPGVELILVFPSGLEFQNELSTIYSELNLLHLSLRAISAPQGRAQQLNAGARASKRPYLFFLHADSRFDRSPTEALERVIEPGKRALYYFDLEFDGEGGSLMQVNAWGANFRSRALKIPFGDQGFCCTRELFLEAGAFNETAPFGEDHLFVWKLRRLGAEIVSVGERILTSSRKYKKGGWTRTTLRHLYLTFRQAAPEFVALVLDKRVAQGRLNKDV